MKRTSSVPKAANAVDGAPLSVELQQRDSALVASLSGELDMAAGERFERVLQRLADGALKDVVIDLRELSFMDSTGLRMLLEADRTAREQRLRLWIIRGGEAVDRVFRMTGMDKVLPLVDEPPDLPT